ncbi:hypothetical protein [Mycobacterium syngnathidarum]
MNSRNAARAERLLLAELDADAEGHVLVLDELGRCAGCWESVARHLSGILVRRWIIPDIIAGRTTHEAVLAWLERSIASWLDNTDDDTPHDHHRGALMDLIPVSQLLAEGFTEAQIPTGAIQFDDIGRRCISRDQARELFRQREERQERAAKRARQQAEKQARQSGQLHERVRAIQRQQAGIDTKGRSAYEVMCMANGHEVVHRPSPMDDYLNGGSLTYHPISEREGQ